jgi:hypothetical protein
MYPEVVEYFISLSPTTSRRRACISAPCMGMGCKSCVMEGFMGDTSLTPVGDTKVLMLKYTLGLCNSA